MQIHGHDKISSNMKRYMSSKDMHDRQNASRVLSLAGEVASLLHLRCPWASEKDHGPSPAGGFVFFV
jgi:hypothetical protein